MNHADKFLQDGDGVIGNFNTPEGSERLNAMLDSLRVSTENLKVVSTNAKALDRDLGAKAVARLLGRPDGHAAARGRSPQVEPGHPPQARRRRQQHR